MKHTADYVNEMDAAKKDEIVKKGHGQLALFIFESKGTTEILKLDK